MIDKYIRKIVWKNATSGEKGAAKTMGMVDTVRVLIGWGFVFLEVGLMIGLIYLNKFLVQDVLGLDGAIVYVFIIIFGLLGVFAVAMIIPFAYDVQLAWLRYISSITDELVAEYSKNNNDIRRKVESYMGDAIIHMAEPYGTLTLFDEEEENENG